MTETNKFSYAECLQIDPEGKNVLFIYYPENIDPQRLECVRDSVLRIQEVLNRWAKEPDSPVYVLGLPWDIRIKIEKTGDDKEKISVWENHLGLGLS